MRFAAVQRISCAGNAGLTSTEIKQNTGKWMFSNELLFRCTGTSNWSEDYFITTAGVGLIIKQNSTNLQRRQLPIQEQLKNLFERDWDSEYAVNLEDVQGQKDCNWGGRLWNELNHTFKIETKHLLNLNLAPLAEQGALFFTSLLAKWLPCGVHVRLMTQTSLVVDSSCKSFSAISFLCVWLPHCRVNETHTVLWEAD